MVYILDEAEKERSGGRAARKDCIFCDLPGQGPDRFRDNLILSCGERSLIILNRFPYNNGHLMVVPRRHVADPSELDAADHAVLTELLRRATAALWQAVHPHGINLGMNLGRTAGAGIERHCHYHLVPRWDGDTNFMPVVGGAKVISEDLWSTWDRLLPVMKGLTGEVEQEAGR